MTKTSEAFYRTVRFNPRTNPADKLVAELIEQAESSGKSFKALVVNALLAQSGVSPDIYNAYASHGLLDSMQAMLERFAQEITASIQASGGVAITLTPDSEDDEDFSRNFARKFMEREQGQ